jgi:hypothetical protein
VTPLCSLCLCSWSRRDSVVSTRLFLLKNDCGTTEVVPFPSMFLPKVFPQPAKGQIARLVKIFNTEGIEETQRENRLLCDSSVPSVFKILVSNLFRSLPHSPALPSASKSA